MAALDTTSPPLAARTGPAEARPAVAAWLFLSAAMVLAMAVIGAITRLTESGLSIVEWRPFMGWLPPASDAEWARVFDAYRQTPEYLQKNAGMTLEEFRRIFFWEWLHRLWGRLIGVVFLLPFLWFLLRGRLPRRAVPGLAGLFALGALQGLMGWVMVQSGLVDRPSVSHYRLAAHLGLAFLIFALLVWIALDMAGAGRGGHPRPGLRRHAWASLGVAAVTILWGAFVAGLDAGLAYNTWPLMDGGALPPGAWSIVPGWLNLFENTALVQFLHRWLAILTALMVLAVGWRLLRERSSAGLGTALILAPLAQAGLGIATLLASVPIWLGAFHQAGAFVVVALLVTAIRSLDPRP